MKCPICRNLITQEQKKCSNCGLLLTGELFQIANFRNDLIDLRKELDLKINTLSEKLDEYERISVKSSLILPIEEEIKGENVAETTENVTEKANTTETHQEKETSNQEEYANALERKQKIKWSKEDNQNFEVPPAKERQKSAFEISILLFFEAFFAPLMQFKAFFLEAYQTYKAQNKLPVFFLTIGGIFALLMAFGYLLSFVSDTTFEIVKVCGTAVSAIGFVVLGVRLYPDDKLKDFGSAMIALGVSINYLLIYFLSTSSFFSFFNSEIIGLLLVLANTAFAYFLALRYETRIVLVISLFCGALAPFYLHNNAVSLFYFVYLWILLVVSIFVSRKIAWEAGVYVAFVLILSIFEGSVFSWYSINFNQIVLGGIALVFAYTFYVYVFFENKKLKENFSLIDTILVAANTAFFLYNMLACYGEFTEFRVLGLVLLANSIIYWAFFLFSRHLSLKHTSSLQILLAATFLAFAVPALFELRINGVVWGVEALFLCILGFNFGYVRVRQEGYLLFAVAIISNLVNLGDIATFWEVRLLHEGFMNLSGLSINLFLLFVVLKRNELAAENFEKVIQNIAIVAAYWTFSISLWVAGHFYFGALYYNFAIIFLFFFLFMGEKHESRWIESLGFAQLAFFAASYLMSVDLVNDFAFRFQSRYAQFALVEMYLSLWFIYLFYDKLMPNGRLKPIAYGLRVLFYLIASIAFLPTTHRFYYEYFAASLWVSVGIAYILYRFTEQKLVIAQIYILCIAAIYAFLIETSLSDFSIHYASAASVLVWIGLWIAEKGFFKPQENDVKGTFDGLLVLSVYCLSYILFLAYTELNERQYETAIFIGFLLMTAFTAFSHRLRALQNSFVLLWRSLQIGLFFALIFYIARGYNSFYAEMTTGLQLYLGILFVISIFALKFNVLYGSNDAHATRGKFFVLDTWVLHLLTILAYWGIIAHLGESWTGLLMTIVLVLHAILLIFNSTILRYKSLIRLSILIFIVSLTKLFWKDLEAYSAVQKVIVMIVIGVLMLIGSFAYAKYKAKSNPPVE